MLELGDIKVRSILDFNDPFLPITDIFKEATPEALAPHLEWLVPQALHPDDHRLVLPIQSYLVETAHHKIVIDTCVGCDKTSRAMPQWRHRRDERWLQRMRAAGVQPEEIDYVFCTHLHVDHCGWNTRLIDGRWKPTFPNAKYVFAKDEYAAVETINSRMFQESVLPIMEAGQALLVDTDYALDDQVWLQPTPGHTVGHVAVNLTSGPHRAAMCGDLIHSPIQCVYPDWQPVFDANPVEACQTRRRFLAEHCDTGNIVLTAHFPLPSMGHIVPRADAFFFEYLR